MLGSLQAARLNSQNTCTSYYDFLTCDRECLESWDCGNKKFIDTPPKEKPIPPPTLNNLIKYYDMDDRAIEWYLGTKQSTLKPYTKKYGYKFRVPIRHVGNRIGIRSELWPYCQSRRISPEFLCLLQKYQEKLAKRSPIYQLPRKMLTGKPSFSYYKYDAAAKSRHMRPGIDTAAPVEFPCKNMSCPRRTLTPEEIEKLNGDQFLCCALKAKRKASNPQAAEPDYDPYCKFSMSLNDKKASATDAKKKCENCAKLYLKENTLLKDLEDEKTADKRYRLHEIYDANCEFRNDKVKRELESERTPRKLHLLYDVNPKAKQIKLKDSRQNLHQIFVASRDVPAIEKTPRKVSPAPDMTDYCPIIKSKVKLGPCEQWICSKRPKCTRDPRAIEYESRPLSKVLLQSDQHRRRSSCRKRCSKNGSRSTSMVTTEDDDGWELRNWTKSLEKEQQQEQRDKECSGYRVRPAEPSNSFYNAVADCPQSVMVHRSERPDLYDQNDVNMPRKRKPNKCGYGFTGFIHHSEKQRMKERCHKSIKDVCKRKKPPPYCYYWSAVDPDVRYEERTRLAEMDCRNRQICKTQRPHTYYWSKVAYNTRKEAKRCLAEKQAAILEKQKQRARLYWSKEGGILNVDKKKRTPQRHGSITSQSSRRSSQFSEENISQAHSKPNFKGNHAKQHSSYYLWSTNKDKVSKPKPPSKRKPKKVKNDDSSSDCACTEEETVLGSSYLSTPRKECHSPEIQANRKRRSTMDRKVYISDRETDKDHMWSGSIQPKQGQDIAYTSDGGNGSRVLRKPRILPNLQAVVKNFFWSGKKSRNRTEDDLSESDQPKISQICHKTNKNDKGPCVRLQEKISHSDQDKLGKLTEEDEANLRQQQPRNLGMERIRKMELEDQKRTNKRESYTRQLRGPRDPNFWSGYKEKRLKSENSRVKKPKRESQTKMALTRHGTRSLTPMSMDTEPESCRSSRRTKIRKSGRTTCQSPADATTLEEELHREPYSYRKRRIQYRNYTGPEPKLSTRYGYQRKRSRSKSPCFASTTSPKRKRKRKRSSLARRCSNTSVASDGYRSPTYSAKEHPCLAAQQKESRAQREWEERRQKKRTKLDACKKRDSHLCVQRSNDWFLTSRAAEPRIKNCRRSLVLSHRSENFPAEPNDWHVVEPTNQDLHQRRERKDFHVVHPSNVDRDAYMDSRRKCGERPGMIYVKRAEETISDGDEDEESNDGCDCADHPKVPQLYDYPTVNCPYAQVKQQKNLQNKKSVTAKQDHHDISSDGGRCKRCSSKPSRIRGGYQREPGQPHSFASSLSSSIQRAHYRNHINVTQNTNWAHGFCF